MIADTVRRVAPSPPLSSLSVSSVSVNFIDASLQTVKRGIPAAGLYQLIVGPILDKPAAVDGQNAIGAPHS